MQEPSGDALIQRLQRFPSLIQGEQFRAWLILASAWVIWVVLLIVVFFVITGIFEAIVSYLIPNLRSGLRSLVGIFGWLACCFLVYRNFGDVFGDTLGALSNFLGAKRNPIRALGVSDVIEILGSRAPFGLYLRAFFDEDGFVPTSRMELTTALAALDMTFIAVENSRTSESQQGLLVLSVPNSQWKATVFELMELADVIVIDVNVGILHWMDELPKMMTDFAREREVDRRLGMVNELEEILARGLEGKSVVLAPPGWRKMMESGEISQQIGREEDEAVKRYVKIIERQGEHARRMDISDVEWFSRTRLKHAICVLPRVAISVQEAICNAQEVILQSGRDNVLSMKEVP